MQSRYFGEEGAVLCSCGRWKRFFFLTVDERKTGTTQKLENIAGENGC